MFYLFYKNIKFLFQWEPKAFGFILRIDHNFEPKFFISPENCQNYKSNNFIKIG